MIRQLLVTITSSYLLLPHLAFGVESETGQTTSPALQPPELGGLETTFSIIKVLAAFLVVAGVMALVFKLLKRIGPGSMSKTGLIDVLDTRMIAPKKYISVVRIAGEDLAIAISESNISLLCTLGPEKKHKVAPQNTAFNQAMDKATTEEENEQ